MTRGNRDGFSLIEIMVSVVILSIGILALAGGSLFTTRDLLRGRRTTAAAGVAQAKLDELRALAASTSTPCTATQFASSSSASTVNEMTLSWTVTTSGALRTVRIITTYRLAAGRTRTDTLTSLIGC